MKLLRRTTVVAVMSAAALLAATTPASAQWLTTGTDFTTNATLRVADTAKVAKDGLSVTWHTQFTCPEGEAYTFNFAAGERDPILIPDIAGEDDAIWARGEAAGTCTGKTQNVDGPLTVVPTVYVDRETGDVITELVPISPSAATSSVATLTTDTGFALWCSAPNCASDSGPRISLR